MSTLILSSKLAAATVRSPISDLPVAFFFFATSAVLCSAKSMPSGRVCADIRSRRPSPMEPCVMTSPSAFNKVVLVRSEGSRSFFSLFPRRGARDGMGGGTVREDLFVFFGT